MWQRLDSYSKCFFFFSFICKYLLNTNGYGIISVNQTNEKKTERKLTLIQFISDIWCVYVFTVRSANACFVSLPVFTLLYALIFRSPFRLFAFVIDSNYHSFLSTFLCEICSQQPIWPRKICAFAFYVMFAQVNFCMEFVNSIKTEHICSIGYF